jgi:UDP-N-acetyl-D-mannosaminuronic acid dehydrogenase
MMKDEVENQTADVTIVDGTSRDGLSLALSMAGRGLTVNVNDSNTEAVEQLKKGQMPFLEHGAARLLKNALTDGRLLFSTSPNGISPRGPIVIAVGTSADMLLNPDRKLLQNCADALRSHIGERRLLILRSSVLPGTTEWFAAYMNRFGQNHMVAYCPERALRGYGIQELEYAPQIVGATTPEAEKEAMALFSSIVTEFVALSPKESEFARLFNNVYRYIEFAAANEFYLIAQSAGLDYARISRGMKHNSPRAKNIPTPGFAGGPHLLPDTLQLAAASGGKFGMTFAALLINEGLVSEIIKILQQQFSIADKTIGLLGMAFKAQSDDVRCSLSYKFKEMLSFYAREVLTTDPFVSGDDDLLPLDEVVSRSDILILCTPHEAYRTISARDKPVVDVWGYLNPNNLSMIQFSPRSADR